MDLSVCPLSWDIILDMRKLRQKNPWLTTACRQCPSVITDQAICKQKVPDALSCQYSKAILGSQHTRSRLSSLSPRCPLCYQTLAHPFRLTLVLP
jgi:hypothetical protein